jgi:hypothetical protein
MLQRKQYSRLACGYVSCRCLIVGSTISGANGSDAATAQGAIVPSSQPGACTPRSIPHADLWPGALDMCASVQTDRNNERKVQPNRVARITTNLTQIQDTLRSQDRRIRYAHIGQISI